MLNSSAAALAETSTSCPLPVLHWDGRSPVALIGRVETRLAAGTRFVVLAAASPLGTGSDRGLLEGWWRAVRSRLGGRCAGWAVLAPQCAPFGQETLTPVADFPIRFCADRDDAVDWLRRRLAEAAAPAPA